MALLSEPELTSDTAFPPPPDAASWRVTRTLRDGTSVTLRGIVPDDAEIQDHGYGNGKVNRKVNRN